LAQKTGGEMTILFVVFALRKLHQQQLTGQRKKSAADHLSCQSNFMINFSLMRVIRLRPLADE